MAQTDLGKVRLTDDELSEKIIQTNGGVKLGKDADGKPGYVVTDAETGADTVVPFSSGGSPGLNIGNSYKYKMLTNVSINGNVNSVYDSELDDDYDFIHVHASAAGASSSPSIYVSCACNSNELASSTGLSGAAYNNTSYRFSSTSRVYFPSKKVEVNGIEYHKEKLKNGDKIRIGVRSTNTVKGSMMASAVKIYNN